MTLDLLFSPEDWMLDGLCAETDPEIFFPDKGGSTREAKAVCGRCPVSAECLAYALAHDERFGIWGGTSERERRKLKGLPDQTDTGACGTYPKGYQRHDRAGEPPCDDCYEAYSIYYARKRTNGGRSAGPVDINQESTMPDTTAQEIPSYVTELTELLVVTDGHADPLVRAVRKIVTQSAVALKQAHDASQTSGSNATATAHTIETPRSTSTSEPEARPKPAQPSQAERMLALGVDAGDIRAWAVEQGLEVSAAGRIRNDVLSAYEQAHARDAA